MGLGYVPEGRRVFPGMSVRDNLEVASFAPKAARTRLIERVFTLFPQLRPNPATARGSFPADSSRCSPSAAR